MFEQYEEILSVDDVMDILSIGRNGAYDLLRHGKIKGFKIGSTWKIPRKSIEEFTCQMTEVK